MIILGDIHCYLSRVTRRVANFDIVSKICKEYPDQTVLQLGDFGVGFIPTQFIIDNSPSNFRFFVGNHDNRTESLKIPNCLGDFGEFEEIFFVSGADSIDKNDRIVGLNYWVDEELSHEHGNLCVELWEKSNQKIIVSHDAPQRFVENHLLIYDKSWTRTILQKMIDIRKPDMIVFGHHHRSYRIQYDSVKYVGLKIEESFIL